MNRVQLAVCGILTLLAGPAAAANQCGAELPLQFAGKDAREGLYAGSWRYFKNGTYHLCAAFAIERINADGSATVVYFWGADPEWRIKEPGAVRVDATISGDTITVPLRGNTAKFSLKGDSAAGTFGSGTPGQFQRTR
jgi:hypothetical protein